MRRLKLFMIAALHTSTAQVFYNKVHDDTTDPQQQAIPHTQKVSGHSASHARLNLTTCSFAEDGRSWLCVCMYVFVYIALSQWVDLCTSLVCKSVYKCLRTGA